MAYLIAFLFAAWVTFCLGFILHCRSTINRFKKVLKNYQRPSMKKTSRKVVAGVAVATAITGAATVALKKHRAKAAAKNQEERDEERESFNNNNANLFI